MSRVIVVGSGIAGLIAAVKAAADHEVILITKDDLGESNTHYAQGGIAAVMSQHDSVAEHVADTLAAGADFCFRPAVEVLCSEGPERINDLVRFGVDFDRSGTDFALGLEAAHSHPRILHAGGDATGADISNALVTATKKSVKQIFEHTFLLEIKVESTANGVKRLAGIEILNSSGREFIAADFVILASGGAGQLYRHTTNPTVTTGDGVAAALRAGAELVDVEFYQFHPTALAVPGSFLISEAVRGEGAVLINQAGERFMQKIHPAAELAPRDVVARGIQSEMLSQGGQPVMLDATSLGTEFLNTRFPSISATTKRYGLNWGKQPIPVTPAAHYWMGGVATDVWGRTSIEGLFAVGEVACTGVHGANRLASNSLLESIVFADRAVRAIGQAWPKEAGLARVRETGSLREIEVEVNDGRTAENLQVVDRVELQTLMWDNVGLARTRQGLNQTTTALNSWRGANEENRLFTDWEDTNLLHLARAITSAATLREESRGGHYRLDYPTPRAEFARPITIIRKA